MNAKLLSAIGLTLGISSGLSAATVDTNSLTLAATVQTRGEYDNAGLGDWNGSPLSPTNQPTYEQDQLSATLSFYIDPGQTNDLFLVVSNVLDTDYGYLEGPAFAFVALTGIDFSLPVSSSAPATFSNQWAVPGEVLAGSSPRPLSTTPGWSLLAVSGFRIFDRHD